MHKKCSIADFEGEGGHMGKECGQPLNADSQQWETDQIFKEVCCTNKLEELLSILFPVKSHIRHY